MENSIAGTLEDNSTFSQDILDAFAVINDKIGISEISVVPEGYSDNAEQSESED